MRRPHALCECLCSSHSVTSCGCKVFRRRDPSQTGVVPDESRSATLHICLNSSSFANERERLTRAIPNLSAKRGSSCVGEP